MHPDFKIPSIGRNIERIRKLRGITQDELANQLRVSRQTLSKIEQSDHVEDDRLDEIAYILGVSKEGRN